MGVRRRYAAVQRDTCSMFVCVCVCVCCLSYDNGSSVLLSASTRHVVATTTEFEFISPRAECAPKPPYLFKKNGITAFVCNFC